MEQLAPSPEEAPALAESVFRTFTEAARTINGFRGGPARLSRSLERWPGKGPGNWTWRQAPLRLLAIVNRGDLRPRQGRRR